LLLHPDLKGKFVSLDEHGLIARHFAPLAGQGAHKLLDDAATLSVKEGCELVVTSDAVVAGVHFFANDPPASIARKALGVNLSDLAAKGATPSGFVMTLGLNESCNETWLTAFASGIGEASRMYLCPLLGGDTVKMPGPATLSITAFGEVPSGQMIMRKGARAGDHVYVTGTIGDAVLGLALSQHSEPEWAHALKQQEREFLIDRYQHPLPRLALGEALRLHASSGMDVSDGLAGDLAKLCRASGLGARLQADHIPFSGAVQAALFVAPELYDRMVTGGDDYEILCTIPACKAADFEQKALLAGVRVTKIGTMQEGEGHPVFEREGRSITYPQGSYSHF
jgi:thiamine-monophosphate kinase